MIDQGITLYLHEVKRHINDYLCELDELSDLTALNSRDYRAAERLLQLLTEVNIGLAKHWVKSIKKSAGANAYQSFIELHDHDLITDSELDRWRKVIGLRNTLVHDYLNVDKRIVKQVIKTKDYNELKDFSDKAFLALEVHLNKS